MTFFERVVTEFSQIEHTEFWKLYLTELAKYRKLKHDKLETCPLDQVQSEQGEVGALKFIGELPKRIISQLAEESNKTGG